MLLAIHTLALVFGITLVTTAGVALHAQETDTSTPDDDCGVASNCGGIGGWRVILLARDADDSGAQSPSDGDMVEDPEKTEENRAPRRVGSIGDQGLTVGGESVTIDVASFFSDPDGDELTYDASSSDERVATASISGSNVTVAPVAEGTAAITVTASDPDGLTAEQTFDATVSAEEPDENRAPRRLGSIGDQGLTVGGESVTIDVASFFSDPDGDVLTYDASSSDERVATASISGSNVTVAPVAEGTAAITVTASDPDGLTAEQTFDATVSAEEPDENRAPGRLGSIGDQALTVGGESVTIDVATFFSDPDGDELTYDASSSDERVATASISGSNVTVAPVAEGTAAITVTASDPDGLTAEQTFDATVSMGEEDDSYCRPEDVLDPGDSCDIYSTQIDFSVSSSGSGCVLAAGITLCQGADIDHSNRVLNGESYRLKATRDGNTWTIEDVSPEPPD